MMGWYDVKSKLDISDTKYCKKNKLAYIETSQWKRRVNARDLNVLMQVNGERFVVGILFGYEIRKHMRFVTTAMSLR